MSSSLEGPQVKMDPGPLERYTESCTANEDVFIQVDIYIARPLDRHTVFLDGPQVRTEFVK